MEDIVDNPNVADSLHGPLYVPIKKLNEEIQVLGKTLSNLKSVDIIHNSDYPNKQKDIDTSILSKSRTSSIIKEILNDNETQVIPKLLIGIFENESNADSSEKYLLIVNKDVDKNSIGNILLNNSFNIFKLDIVTGQKMFINHSNKININILAGSGELYFLK